MTDLFKQKITIYNDIPADSVNPRRFDRFVVEKCNIQKGILSKTDGTIENIVNGIEVVTKDVKRYKTFSEYKNLPEDLRNDLFTANVNDFVVLAEVDDVVTNATEFSTLKQKYKNKGFIVRTIGEGIFGLDTDNISLSNVG